MIIDKKWVDGIKIYCEILLETNRKVFELVSLSGLENIYGVERVFLDISQNLMRLIPCKGSSNSTEITLANGEGILDFVSDLNFLKEDYNSLFIKNQASLYNIKQIRNKTEHIPHKLSAKNLWSVSGNPTVNFEYGKNIYQIGSSDIIKIIEELNTIFVKIIEELKAFKNNLSKENQKHPYFKKYAELDFSRFNRILNSDLLYDICKTINY